MTDKRLIDLPVVTVINPTDVILVSTAAGVTSQITQPNAKASLGTPLTAATVVQQQSACTTTDALVTLAGAPTAGNLLVAICSVWSAGATIGAGWTQVVSVSGANDIQKIAYKVCGASETAAQTPYTGVTNASSTIYEVTNWNFLSAPSFTVLKGEATNTGSTIAAVAPAASHLLLGQISSVSTGAAIHPNSSSGATVGTSNSTLGTGSGATRNCDSVVKALSAGSNSITWGFASSITNYFTAVLVGPKLG